MSKIEHYCGKNHYHHVIILPSCQSDIVKGWMELLIWTLQDFVSYKKLILN